MRGLPAFLLLSAAPRAAALSLGSLTPRVSQHVRSPLLRAVAEPPVRAPAVVSPPSDVISHEEPLHVLIAGAGVGGLALANYLHFAAEKGAPVTYTVLERTTEFKRFGGPIQLASNALREFMAIDESLYSEIEARATWTGNRTNGIKDGVRDEWYARFDLKTPAEIRDMPFTCVVDRPDLQEILLERTSKHVKNDAAVASYKHEGNGVIATLENGETVHGDVLVGADGIWSAVRASMRNEPARGEGSGVTYSGYTVFAGELDYSGMDPTSGYTVYIGPQQYFVITDIGKGRYQWYAFLAREAGSEATEPKPDGSSAYLQNLFTGWSPDIHNILTVTKEHEIEQRDLYDRPPSVLKKWGDGKATLMGDAVHAMMPNLGQGGCQAIEDACVLGEELQKCKTRDQVNGALIRYRARRNARSAAVQGLSRIASDIIIQGFDTPAKLEFDPKVPGGFRAENLNYAGIVTRMLQPVLPIFFSVQFNFLYSGWANEPLALEPIRDFFVLFPAVLGSGLALDAVLGGEIFEGLTVGFGEQINTITTFFESIGEMF